MQFTISAIVGVTIGLLAVIFIGLSKGQKEAPPAKPTPLAWTVLGLGAIALVVTALSILAMTGLDVRYSVALSAASLTAAIGAIVKHERHWPTWAGLACALLPVGFWVFFVAAEFLYPH